MAGAVRMVVWRQEAGRTATTAESRMSGDRASHSAQSRLWGPAAEQLLRASRISHSKFRESPSVSAVFRVRAIFD